MFAAFFMGFFSFFDVCRFPAITPARRGKCCSLSSIRSTSADADHRTLHIMHCSKSLYTNITPFFPTLQADPSDSANDTKTAPASCYRNRGGSLALFVLFQALTQSLAGVFNSSLGGCQNYRAFGTVFCRFFNTLYLQRTASLY